MPMLYDLENDIAEEHDLAKVHPLIVKRLTRQFEALIEDGASRPSLNAHNDTAVRFDTIQKQRWAPPITK